MTFYGTCGSCDKKRFFIKKRKYTIAKLGKAVSKNELCYSCYKIIKEINKQLTTK